MRQSAYKDTDFHPNSWQKKSFRNIT